MLEAAYPLRLKRGAAAATIRRVHERVVVEVDVHVAAGVEPLVRLRGPHGQLVVGVVAGIQGLRAVKTHIDEVRRHLLGIAEGSRAVGDDERTTMLAEDLIKLVMKV